MRSLSAPRLVRRLAVTPRSSTLALTASPSTSTSTSTSTSASTSAPTSARTCRLPASRRLFSTTRPSRLQTSLPRCGAPPSTIAAYKPSAALEPAPLSDTEYHALADGYLDRLLVLLEDMQDAREDVDVEYSSGVLTLAFDAPQGGAGGARARTYVINKQPPNRQIWLSSPVSGPKRYDWVVDGEGGRWVYLKDNTAFNDLLRDEIGLDLDEQE